MDKIYVKQVIVLRKDLKMPAGKACSQSAHASLTAITNLMYVDPEDTEFNEDPAIFRELNTFQNSPLNLWLTGSQTKICLAVNSLEELDTYFDLAQKANLPCSYIVDNGHTVFNNVATPTAIAIGPAWANEIDALTSSLKLY